jgi:hypothetical protein
MPVTPLITVTVGGYSGQLLDLQLAPSWTGGSLAPEGLLVGSLILRNAGASPGPVIALTPDVPQRLVLLGPGDEGTIAIAVACFGSSRPDVLEAAIDDAMPVIESYEFHLPAPPASDCRSPARSGGSHHGSRRCVPPSTGRW